MQWYYSINGQRLGPVSEAEFEKLVSDGVIQPATLVWREGMSEWQTHAKATGAAAPAEGAAASSGDDTEVCAVSGKRYPRREMIQYEGKWVSAEHRDEFFQRLREGVGEAGKFNYGGFGRRWVAKIIDGLILAVAVVGTNMLIASAMLGNPNYFMPNPETETGTMLAFQGAALLAQIALGLAFDLIFLTRFQATPGKLALGLKVIRADGSRLGVGRIIGRYFAELLSKITLYIGYLIAAFDEEQRRTLHDRICDTRVIRVESAK